MTEADYLRLALRLARRGCGATSPNPMVGAVLVKRGQIIGRGWHRRAGGPHAEIEALEDARRRGQEARGATLYVTLEPCCTHGRTPPCTDALIAAGIKRVVAGAADPNPQHAGRGFKILRRAGVEAITLRDEGGARHAVRAGPRSGQRRAPGDARCRRLADACARLNEAFNHWIVHRTPFVTVKAAMTLDGKIATARGESKWITGEPARAQGMKLRQAADAILVGVNTVLADDPSLTFRSPRTGAGNRKAEARRRIILDSRARTPLNARVVRDEHAPQTTVVVTRHAPKKRVTALARRVRVLVAPTARGPQPGRRPGVDLRWLLRKLGAENVTSLLVEGGGEVNASFLLGGLAQRVVFFYAPKILGGRDARKAVAGEGIGNLSEGLRLREIAWRRVGPDLWLTARVEALRGKPPL
jgi:diaminohydroxyphosphoribosylaminopyrimidine deaminase/5-amino-6-(5-phosphoribosylamino)uracil reductase